jgi:hypothetical protein
VEVAAAAARNATLRALLSEQERTHDYHLPPGGLVDSGVCFAVAIWSRFDDRQKETDIARLL